jgi:hypothetical protein
LTGQVFRWIFDFSVRHTAKEKDFAVVDDVFEKDAFSEFHAYFNNLEFAYRSMQGWAKVWRLTDGQVVVGKTQIHSMAPFDSALDLLHRVVLSLARTQFQDIVGKEGEDWDDVSFTPYIYPPGTRISWHDDYGYSGACIFYPHLEWSANWGGELLVAKTPPPDTVGGSPDVRDKIVPDPQSHQSLLLNHFGMGVYLSPIPNRIVFTRGEAMHSMSWVDQSAGDHCRLSVVSFFRKDPGRVRNDA